MQVKHYLPPGIRRILICSLITLQLCFTPGRLYAQDLQFSLFQFTPLHLNSSYTGVFEGNWRFSANYRNQWTGSAIPFRTAAAGVDSKVHLGKQALGIGLFVMDDESGAGGLHFSKIYASLGYQINLGTQYLRIGIQPGYVFGSFNSWNNWDHETGTFSAPSNEPNFGESANYFDLNAGVSWQGNFNRILTEGGLSLLHLNRPNISFFDGDAPQSMIALMNAGARIGLNERISLSPAFLMQFGSGVYLTALGTGLEYRFSGRTQVKEIFISCFLRNGLLDELSSLAISAGFRMKKLDLVIDYDINVGNYSNSAGSMGAFEIAVIYRSITTLLNSYSIPCERI